MMTPHTKLSKQRGLTLVEILVAMVMGTFLIGGVLEAYLSTKQTSVMQDNLSRLQENGRLAINRLSKEIRLAGFHGNTGFKGAPTTAIAAGLPLQPSPNTFISGTHEGQPNFWPSAQQANAIPNTDTITVIHASSCGGKLQADMVSIAAAIQISATARDNCNINAGDALFISDDKSQDIFFATNTNSTNVTHAPLARAYTITAYKAPELFTYHINSFYIGTGTNGNPSLFLYDNVRGLTTELVENIEDLQILYGINIDGNNNPSPNFYVNSEGILLNAANIVSAKISIVVASTDAVAQSPTPYTINGITVTPPDNRIRRVFTTVLSLRNRLP